MHTFSELETFSNEACSLTELSFLSRNHLPSLPHVKELIKLPQTCLFSPEIASLLVSPLSFFDIFVRIIHLSCCCDIKKKCSWLLKMAYPPHPSFLQALSTKRGLVCIHDASLFSFPGRPFTSPHPSPSPTQPHTLSSLRAISEQNARLLVPAMDHLFAHYL